MIEIGLEYDKSLTKKHKDIVMSLAKNNNNQCGICFTGFDPNDENEAPFSLSCGHQYCKNCWSHYLKSKVADEGAMCVFSKCPQLRCNMVIPHSVYLMFLKRFINDNGINYLEKYNQWHCK